MTELTLGYNHLTHIPFTVSQAFNLRTLTAFNNQIKTIEDGDLARLHNLTTLSLFVNPLVNISSFAFTHNLFLNDLDMRYTKVERIPRSLVDLRHLNKVNLSGGKHIECSCQAMDNLKSWNVTSISIYGTCSSGKSVKTYLTTDLPKCP